MKNRLLLLLICALTGLPNLFSQSTFLINEGSSTDCTGQLFDTGGPDGNYGTDENNVFVICPAGGSDCIEFTLEYYDFDNTTGGDRLTIYDGDFNNEIAEEIVVLGGTANSGGEADGGVCFRTFATNGCLSVAFNSDGDSERAGFSASWNCAPADCDAALPIEVDTSVTLDALTESIRRPGTVISNITLNCPSGQYGVFTGDGSDLGIPTGILLTTGSAAAAVGPNTGGSLGSDQLAPFGPGDADLDSLGTLLGDFNISQDACVLELDVVVNTDELVFDYAFGSDEYPEFVDNQVNDIFAFFISGPGIDGVAELNGQQNIAVLDNEQQTVVQIDSINDNSNNQYYRNNRLGQSVAYDGITSGYRGDPKTLRARANVIPCETYHLKLAIADRGDHLYDSGVFIGGLDGGLPDIDITMTAGIDFLVEECLNVEDSIRITYNNRKDVPQSFELQTGGSAERNVDYILPGLPANIVFPPGLSVLTFPIVIIADGTEEGEEEITFTFVADFGCNTDVDVSAVSIPLRDRIDVELVAENSTGPIYFCPGSTFDLSATGASSYTWSTNTGVIIATGNVTSVTPEGDGQVTLVGTVGFCTDTLVFDLVAVETEVEITNPDTLMICRGDTVQLMQTNNVEDQGVNWLTTSGFIDSPDTPNPFVVPNFSRFYTVEVGPGGGCSAKDSIYIDVDVFIVPELISDTLLCQGYPIMLASDSLRVTGNTLYDFSPGDFLADSTDVNAVYDPAVFIDTTFTLVSTAENGACSDTQSVRVELIRSNLEIFGGDTIFRCVGDEVTVIEVGADPFAGLDVRWFPSTGVIGSTTESTLRVAPQTEVKYYVEAIVNGCYQIDSVVVRTDSLPANTDLTLDPLKDPFCQGDTFYIQSPIYDVGDFPLITHEWTVAPGIASPQELYNAVVFAQDSALFTRITENGACGRIDTFQVNVIKPPILIFDPADPSVCPGTPLQINVSFDPSGPNGELEWEDPNGTLSCDDCLDPVATVNEPTSYNIEVTSEGSDCTMPSMYAIDIIVDQEPVLTNETTVCTGDARRVIVGNINPDYTYRIVGGGIDSSDPEVLVTPPADNTTYVVTTIGECETFTDEVTFRLRDQFTVSASGPEVVCKGDDVTLTAQLSDDTQGTFVWTVDGEEIGTGIQISVTPEMAATYVVTFTGDACGTTATASTSVDVVAADFEPIVIATLENGVEVDTVFSGNTVTLSVLGVPDGLAVNYEWSGNLNPDMGNGETITVMVPGPNENAPDNLRYNVTVTTQEGGCPFFDGIVTKIEESDYEIPELITPNGDDVNDEFRVYYGGQITDFSMIIFNRWGQQIYSSSDVDQAWDGTKNGTPQNSDIYLYLVKFRINGAEVSEEGQFSLVR
ncbi:T9SS type B sorting domain-containing protein [Neolewinella aurantiaca]|uniref:T9SS type B sorting domain-containing protein n=1 Tax=Neolewinella aurantiaca TaxID=2602767 RepID=A0A5C7FQZ4_9BACT|nr:choice-of-anchor L domain-containing protein [Neolewinella aurantiaca]TXF87815.1 T9SS type B sorting domain-containing protein [Neolewinella aurantiaca]